MDWLLPEIAAEVARYLTPQDLSACCAVSPQWRLAFNTDQVWMPLCDPDLEEHLRTTPCVVQPEFQLPQAPGSSLAPICQWRAAFLREQHLWRNWRNGNYRIVEHILEGSKIKSSMERFVSDDFIVCFYLNSIQLWDVRVTPPVCVDEYFYNNEGFHQPIICENGLVILKCHEGDFIRVIKADLTEGTITMKYCIYFKQSIKLPEMVCNASGSMESERYSLNGFDFFTLGTRFVGSFRFKKDFNSFSILDLESGVKVKEEPSPCHFGGGFRILGPNKWSQNCHDVLVIGNDDPEIPDSKRVCVKCHVYDVEQLTFFPFSHTFWAPVGLVFYHGDVCAITNNFVATSECGSTVDDNDYDDFVKLVRIFNYRTGHQVHVIEAYSDVQIIDNSCFLFINSTEYATSYPKDSINNRLFLVVNPSGELIKDVADSHLEFFEVVGRKLVGIQIVYGNKFLWHISHSRFLRIFKTGVSFLELREVNQAGTRLILDRIDDKEIIRLVYLW